MPDEMAVMEWETDGGYSPPINDPQSNQYDISSQKCRRCVVCGDDRAAPKICEDGKNWSCLAHRPKLGQSQRRKVRA